MAKTKKTRKELLKEPDEFITTTGKLIQWGIKYQTQLTYALIVLVVIALVVSTYRFFDLRAETQAANLLAQAVNRYEQLKANKTPAEVFKAVAGEFQPILDKYGNKENGKMARLRFANIAFEAAEYKQSIPLYQKALVQFDLHPLLKNQILMNLAMAHFNLGQAPAAIEYFEKIVSGTVAFNKDEALFHLGTLYARSGQKDKSQAVFTRLTNEFGDSTYKDLIPQQTNG